MRQKIVNIYKFEELSEEAKDKAIENLSDINVDFDWWDWVYEDAERAGLKLTSFDIYRREIEGKLIDGAENSIKEVLTDHGDTCATYKTATKYKEKFNESCSTEERREELTTEYLKDILKDYLVILREEYEYKTSREAIIETIEANDYEFTEEGKLTR